MGNMKRMMTGVLAVSMSLSMAFVGCSKLDNTGQAGATTAGTASDSGKLNVSLNFLSYQDNFDPTQDFERQNIKDVLGVDIIPSMGNDDDKVTLALSSNQDYDMISMNNRNLLAEYAKNGAIQPLNDLIDKYGPNLKKAFTQDQWNMVSSQGKIFAIPTFNYDAVTDGLVIRQDWLDKLGLQTPTTPEELYAVLKAFKEKDPGGVGKDKVVPFAFSAGDDGNRLNISGLAEAFGIGRGPTDFIIKDGKIESSLDQPGAKEYVTFLNKLYTDGLLDQDIATTKHDKVVQLVGAGQVGVAALSCWDSAALKALVAKDPNAKLTFLPPMKAKDGSQSISGTGGLYSFVIVPKVSKHAADVVKYANAFLDPKNYTKLILGEENVTYKIDGGKYYPIFPAFDKLNKGRWFYPVNEAKMYTPLFGARARKEKEMGQLWDDINAKDAKYMYTPIINNAPVVPSEQKYGQALRVFAQQNLVKMLIDKKELENFDVFEKQYNDKGGSALVNDYNAWYQTTKK